MVSLSLPHASQLLHTRMTPLSLHVTAITCVIRIINHYHNTYPRVPKHITYGTLHYKHLTKCETSFIKIHANKEN